MRDKKRVKYQNTSFYFDNCAVWEFMKDVDEGKKQHTEVELRKAFKEAENKGAVVGGLDEKTRKSALKNNLY